MAPYSQFVAFRALVKAAFRSIIKSPSSVIFTIAFPLVFIVGFGFMGSDSGKVQDIGFLPAVDTGAQFYRSLKQESLIRLVPVAVADVQYALENELVMAVLEKNDDSAGTYTLVGNPYHENELKWIRLLVSAHLDPHLPGKVDTRLVNANKRKPIDFILTGQLGFSLLAAAVFGVAFVFFGLRQELVLKRFFATPIRKWNILLAEGFARMLFQLFGALLLIVTGYYVFDFTLSEGAWTVVKLLVVSGIGVMMFMSFGFVISGLARSNATVPPLANVLVLPQFILAGTFIPIAKFPEWLQWIAKALPLTYLNEAFRKIATEGAGFWEVRVEMAALLIWGLIGYACAARLFKWE